MADATRDDPEDNFIVFSKRYWAGPLALEPYGLFRLTFGFVTLYTSLDLLPYLRAYFSDEGVLPRQALFNYVRANRFCIMDVSGQPWIAYLGWFALIAAATCFTIGYKTRWASIATFVLFSGFCERLLDAFDGADSVIRVMLFWSMFLPLGARYSMDALQRRKTGLVPVNQAWVLPIRLAELQFAWVYFSSYLFKWSGERWRDGTALHYALSLPHSFVRPIGLMIRNQALPIKIASWGSLAFEASFLFVMIAPFWQPYLRRFIVLGGIAFHGGIFLLMSVGRFPGVMICIYPLILDEAAAKWIVRVLRGFIARAMNRVRAIEGWAMRALEVLEDDTPGPVKPDERGVWERVQYVVGGGVLATLLVGALWISAPPYLEQKLHRSMPEWLHRATQTAELWQRWDMFSPNPMLADVWLTGEGKTGNGTDVDVFAIHGRERFFPAGTTLFFSRWKKLELNTADAGEGPLLEMGKYICREWNTGVTGDARLYSFELTRHARQTEPIGQPQNEEQSHMIWRHHCYEMSPIGGATTEPPRRRPMNPAPAPPQPAPTTPTP